MQKVPNQFPVRVFSVAELNSSGVSEKGALGWNDQNISRSARRPGKEIHLKYLHFVNVLSAPRLIRLNKNKTSSVGCTTVFAHHHRSSFSATKAEALIKEAETVKLQLSCNRETFRRLAEAAHISNPPPVSNGRVRAAKLRI